MAKLSRAAEADIEVIRAFDARTDVRACWLLVLTLVLTSVLHVFLERYRTELHVAGVAGGGIFVLRSNSEQSASHLNVRFSRVCRVRLASGACTM